jgi:phytol kinase
MNEQYLSTLIYAVLFLALFAFAEVLYHKFKVRGELTRKLVHFSSGILSMSFPTFLESHYYVLFLTISFLGILILSLKFNFLPSINAVDRTTHGSVIFPLVIYGCFLCSELTHRVEYFYLPTIVLAVGDPMANIFGKWLQWKPYSSFGHTKTWSGSLAFAISAFVVSLFVLCFLSSMNQNQSLILAGLIAFSTASIEAITHKGFDNLTIPAMTLLVLFLFESFVII